jgi:hypothetical protein
LAGSPVGERVFPLFGTGATQDGLRNFKFALDSALEEGVCCELVSEMGSPTAAAIRRDSEGFMG